MTVKEQFENMTDAEHTAMKARLLEIAKKALPDANKPDPQTLEGYALEQYTTPRSSEAVR